MKKVLESVGKIIYPSPRMFNRIGLVIGCLILSICGTAAAKLNVRWPTDHPPDDLQESLHSMLQPTSSGIIQSGNFGCVRSGGAQFHEGIDLKSFSRDSRGESTDIIRSILPGKVVYVIGHPGKSSYGRYLLIEHSDGKINFISMYAHLRSIEPGIEPGAQVEAGQKIAIMGRSATYNIPRYRAHLHFEVCLLLTDRFQSWYDWKDYPNKNLHGNYNGVNLRGIDTVAFFEEMYWDKKQMFGDVLDKQPTAITIVVGTPIVPDYARRYPSLVNGAIPSSGLTGWKVDFTWYGVPKKLTPLTVSKDVLANGKVALVSHDAELLKANRCRGLLRTRNGKTTIGTELKTILQLLFGFR